MDAHPTPTEGSIVVLAPSTTSPPSGATFAELAAYSAQRDKGEEPTASAETAAFTPAPTSPPEAMERVRAVLAEPDHLGKPRDITEIVVDVNEDVADDSYLSQGQVQAALDTLPGVKVTMEGEPNRPHYALPAETGDGEVTGVDGAPLDILAETACRAAVLSVLASGKAYDEDKAGLVPADVVDAFQVAFALHTVASEASPLIYISPADVKVITDGLQGDYVDTLTERVNARLLSLADAGMVELVKAVLSTADQADGDAEEDGDAKPTAEVETWRLTEKGRQAMLEIGARGLAASTLPPPSPTVPEQIEAACVPLRDERRAVQRELDAVTTQRNGAMTEAESLRTANSAYRQWFVDHDIPEPDVGGRRPVAERKVLTKHTMEIVIDDRQHWRIVEEWEQAKIALTQVQEGAETAKDAWKGKVKAAEELVNKLGAMITWHGRHMIEKSVWKEAKGGKVCIYSADEHDYGTLICEEPMSRLRPGTQLVVEGAAEIVEPPPKAVKAKAVEAAVSAIAAAGFTVTVSTPAGSTPTAPAQEPLPERVLSHLRQKGPTTGERLCIDLSVDPVDLAKALGELGSRIEKRGHEWCAVAEPTPPVQEEEKPKAKANSDLSVNGIRAGLKLLFHDPDVAKTGLLERDVPSVYAQRYDIGMTDSVERLIRTTVALVKTDGTLAAGEGGEDTLLWANDMPDPRTSGADRQAPATAKAPRGRRKPAAKPDPEPEPEKEGGKGKRGRGKDKAGA